MIDLRSKLPGGETTIFTVMSALAKKYDAINLGQGYPNYDCPEGLRERVAHYLNDEKNQYCPMAGLLELRQVLSDKIEKLYALKISPENEITIVAGATQALFTAIMAFVHKGDEVIVIEPAYDSYIPSIRLVGGIPVPYALSSPEFKVDWEELGQLVTDKTKMMIINTPQNPIGKTLKVKDLKALEALTSGTDIIVLSDEVYEHLVYDDQAHQSVLRYPELYKRSMAVYSFGKTFHSTGWKIGYCVAPEYLMEEFRKVHQWNVFCVNSFEQYALADYLTDPAHYNYLPEFYQKKRDLLGETMSESRFTALESEGTFFQLFDYSNISDLPDTEFVKQLTIDHKVTAIPVSVFYTDKRQEGVIRLCFAKTDDILIEAGQSLSSI